MQPNSHTMVVSAAYSLERDHRCFGAFARSRKALACRIEFESNLAVKSADSKSMTSTHIFPPDILERYEVQEWRNACAVLSVAHPEEWADIIALLRQFRLLRSDIGETGVKGGGKSLVAIRIDQMFRARKWRARQFHTAIHVDDIIRESPTHEIDCYKNGVALELEWNNKTEFYDRDLSNFRLLFDLRAIEVGVVLTRCDELQAIFNSLGRGPSYGPTSTIFSKLRRKLEGGAGGGCPVLAIGMKSSLYIDDVTDPTLSTGFERIVRSNRRTRRIR